MEALFKRYYWVIKALGIAGATGLAASAVTTQVGTKLVLDTSTDAQGDATPEGDDAGEEDDEDDTAGALRGLRGNPFQPRGAARGAGNGAAKRDVATAIQKRNIFCPTCAPVEAAVPEDGPPGVAAGNIRPGEIKSSLPLRLMATMEADDPEYSIATVFDDDAGSAGLYGPGDFIRPGVAVVAVDMGVLHIRNNAQFEYIEMSGEPPSKARSKDDRKAKDNKKDEPRKPNDREIPGAKDAINCPNDNLCIVERPFVEQLMANPAQLAKQARIVPSQKDGETQGFKFYGIRRNSLPNLLGIKNGDMITEINGEPLNSVDKAMGLYTKLRRASNLTVTLQRKGQTISKEIQIQ